MTTNLGIHPPVYSCFDMFCILYTWKLTLVSINVKILIKFSAGVNVSSMSELEIVYFS